MFWKLIALLLVLWGAGVYLSFTLGGLIHALPLAAIVFVIARRMARPPNTEYGRWRSAAERMGKR